MQITSTRGSRGVILLLKVVLSLRMSYCVLVKLLICTLTRIHLGLHVFATVLRSSVKMCVGVGVLLPPSSPLTYLVRHRRRERVHFVLMKHSGESGR